jgi:hypothetical protein
MIRSSRDDGYSMIELVIVLLLLSFITAAIAGGFRFGTRIWETTDTVVTGDRHVAALQGVLRTLLASAVPKLKGSYVAFDGTPTELAFYATAPAAMQSGGLVRVEITLLRRGDVAITITPAHGDARHATFVSSADGLTIAYLDASEETPQWLGRWHDRKYLPAALRIEGETEAARARWPDFVAKIPIDQMPLCAFDPVSLDCRSS